MQDLRLYVKQETGWKGPGGGGGSGRYFYSIKGTVQCAFYYPARVRTYCSRCILLPDSKGV